MPLPMQGDKLFPCRQRVVGRSLRTCPPNRGCGDGLVNAGRGFRKSSPAEFGGHGRPVRRAAVGENVDQFAFQLGGLGVAELHCGKLLQMIMQKPRMVDHGLQDERLAQRNGGALAAMNRTRGGLRARRNIRLATKQACCRWRTAPNEWGITISPSTSVAWAPFAPRRPTGSLPRLRALVDIELTSQPVAEIAAIVFAHGVVRDHR